MSPRGGAASRPRRRDCPDWTARGPPLYDEPDQFYSPDKFGPLDLTAGNTRIDPAFPALIAETLGYGFKGVWIVLGGDDGPRGYPIALTQTQMLGPALATYPDGNLHRYTQQFPGWDGVWHKPDGSGTGYTPQQIRDWAAAARQAGALYVGIEHANGYELVGGGRSDYAPGGVMTGYDTILGEYDGPRLDTDDTYQVLARYIGPAYVRPPSQAPDDDPGSPFGPNAPQFLLAETTDWGDYAYRVFEYFMYDFVRGASTSTVLRTKTALEQMGALDVC